MRHERLARLASSTEKRAVTGVEPCRSLYKPLGAFVPLVLGAFVPAGACEGTGSWVYVPLADASQTAPAGAVAGDIGACGPVLHDVNNETVQQRVLGREASHPPGERPSRLLP